MLQPPLCTLCRPPWARPPCGMIPQQLAPHRLITCRRLHKIHQQPYLASQTYKVNMWQHMLCEDMPSCGQVLSSTTEVTHAHLHHRYCRLQSLLQPHPVASLLRCPCCWPCSVAKQGEAPCVTHPCVLQQLPGSVAAAAATSASSSSCGALQVHTHAYLSSCQCVSILQLLA